MARPRKKGIDYFSVDVSIMSDRKTRRVMRSCGIESIAVIIQLLCLSYSEKGYYLEFDNNLIFDVADVLNTDEKYINEVILACVQAGFFDKNMFETHNILTSKRMQKNYKEATEKRINNDINPSFNLVSAEETPVSGEETQPKEEKEGVSADETLVSGVRSTQSKVKHSKEENRRVKKSKENKSKRLDDVNIEEAESAREEDEDKLYEDEELLLEDVFGKVTEYIKREYIELEKKYGWAKVQPALKKTQLMGGETINYTKKILEENCAVSA